ncbi:RPF2 [Symbiodinium sp. CCMP2456]|nr:RPF2 [Symbiodinium sp. CCMP2456]
MRKHEEHPFEDSHKLEQLCKKFDHSLFAFGSSSKKRPARLILGRLFDGHLLDMQEFGVEDYKSMSHRSWKPL